MTLNILLMKNIRKSIRIKSNHKNLMNLRVSFDIISTHVLLTASAKVHLPELKFK